MVETYVVNASPIILLGKIGRLDILTYLGVKLHVPSAVIDEISVGMDGTTLSSELRRITTVKIVPQVNVPPAIAQWELGTGESQSNPTRVTFNSSGRRWLESLSIDEESWYQERLRDGSQADVRLYPSQSDTRGST